MKKKEKKCKLPTGSKVVQLGQTANSGVKIMQPKTTGPYLSQLKQFSFSFQSCWLEVSDIFWLSDFTPLLERSFLPRSPGGLQPYCSQDAMDEDGHDGGTDQAWDGHSHEPSHEDVSEQSPVYGLPRAQPSHGDHRAHLETQQLSQTSHLKFMTSNYPSVKLHNGGSCSVFGESTRLFVCLPHSSHFPHVSVLSTDRSIWPAYLAVGGGDRQANVRSYHHSHGRGQLDAETTAGEWETTPMSS